jgi:hypothetical protein
MSLDVELLCRWRAKLKALHKGPAAYRHTCDGVVTRWPRPQSIYRINAIGSRGFFLLLIRSKFYPDMFRHMTAILRRSWVPYKLPKRGCGLRKWGVVGPQGRVIIRTRRLHRTPLGWGIVHPRWKWKAAPRQKVIHYLHMGQRPSKQSELQVMISETFSGSRLAWWWLMWVETCCTNDSGK